MEGPTHGHTRVHTVQTYPVLSPQGATVVLYGHEDGLTIVWRGGRRFKASVYDDLAQKQKAKHEKTHVESSKELDTLAKQLEKAEEDMRAQLENASGYKQQAEEAQEVRDLPDFRSRHADRIERSLRQRKRSCRL